MAILKTSNGAPRVWAGPVGPTASFAGVRVGFPSDRCCADGALHSGANDLAEMNRGRTAEAPPISPSQIRSICSVRAA